MKLLSRLFLGLVAVSAAAVRAQDFPAARVTMVVAFSAGGPVDVVARVLADRLAQRWGVPVTVENRTGAGGNIAAAIVAKAAPDGYTVLLTATGVAINQSLSANPGFAIADLIPVLLPTLSTTTLAVNPDNPARTLAEFITAHRSGGFTFGTAGIGSAAHITPSYLSKASTGVERSPTPVPGAPPAGPAPPRNHIRPLSGPSPATGPCMPRRRLGAAGVSR